MTSSMPDRLENVVLFLLTLNSTKNKQDGKNMILDKQSQVFFKNQRRIKRATTQLDITLVAHGREQQIENVMDY
jgi:hypothetical protein